MTGRQEWLLVATVVVLTIAQLSPPRYVPRGLKPPINKRHCRLNLVSPYAWVVGIRDASPISISPAGTRYVSMGSMITPIALVTTCRQFSVRHINKTYVAVGLFIWNTSHLDDTCIQEKSIAHIERHFHCHTKHKSFFDFAVFTLKAPFDITGTTYPLAPIPLTPFELLWRIIRYDKTPKTKNCSLPRFRDQFRRIPQFNWKASAVQAIPYHSECVKVLCQLEPADEKFSRGCETSLGDRANGTLLCMKIINESEIKLGANHEYWYAGTPLVCLSTALAMTTLPKKRMQWSPPQFDFHYGITFLRTWIWLREMIDTHQPSWMRKERMYVENITEKGLFIPRPFTELPPLGHGVLRSVANVPASILQNWICPMLIFFLVIQP